MLIARSLVLLLLVAGIVCFAMYLGTGQQRFKVMGVLIIKWTVIAGLAFFAVLILERVVTLV